MTNAADIAGVPAGPNQPLVDVHQAAIAAARKLAEHQANGRQARVFVAVLAFTALWCRYRDHVSLSRLAEYAGVRLGTRRDIERHTADALRWLDERGIVFYVPGRGRRASVVGIWPASAEENDPLTSGRILPQSNRIAEENDPLISGRFRREMRKIPAHNAEDSDPVSKVSPRDTKRDGRRSAAGAGSAAAGDVLDKPGLIDLSGINAA